MKDQSPPSQALELTQSEQAVILAMRRLSDHQRELITRTVVALAMTDEQRLAIIADFAESTVIELSRVQGGAK